MRPGKAVRSGVVIALALLAVAGGVLLATGEPPATTCTSPDCSPSFAGSPDPGGSEGAPVQAASVGTHFGINDNAQYEGLEPVLLSIAVRATGADVRRFPVDWRLLEPTRDRWDESHWAYYEEAYRTSLAQGVTPLIDFGFAPAWARAPGPARACQDFFACRFPPARHANREWAEFAAEVARRFPRAILEVWNEPNLAIFWRPHPDPRRFAELQRLAYRAIKRVDPSIEVLAGGLSPIQAPGSPVAGAGPDDVPLAAFLDGAYESGERFAQHMDALSFHPYPFGPDLGAGSFFATAFAQVRSAAAAHGDDGRPLWITETGVPSSGVGAVTEAEQAEILLRLYERLSTMDDVEGFVFHRLLPPVEEAPGSTDSGYALLRTPTAPKPAFCEFVALSGRTFPGCS